MLYTIYLAQQIIALIESRTALFSSCVAAGAMGTELLKIQPASPSYRCSSASPLAPLPAAHWPAHPGPWAWSQTLAEEPVGGPAELRAWRAFPFAVSVPLAFVSSLLLGMSLGSWGVEG